MPDSPNTLSRSAIGRPLGVFRHRPFLIFWIGACISNTGNWTENAAQSWAVTSQTIGNPPPGPSRRDLAVCGLLPRAPARAARRRNLGPGEPEGLVNHLAGVGVCARRGPCRRSLPGAGDALGRYRLYVSGRDRMGSQRPGLPFSRAQSGSTRGTEPGPRTELRAIQYGQALRSHVGGGAYRCHRCRGCLHLQCLHVPSAVGRPVARHSERSRPAPRQDRSPSTTTSARA